MKEKKDNKQTKEMRIWVKEKNVYGLEFSKVEVFDLRERERERRKESALKITRVGDKLQKLNSSLSIFSFFTLFYDRHLKIILDFIRFTWIMVFSNHLIY